MALKRTITKQKNGQYVMTVPSQLAQAMLGDKTKEEVEVIPVSKDEFRVRK